MYRWGDYVVTDRGRRLGWTLLVLAMLGGLVAAMLTPDPCEGRFGSELAECQSLYYP